MMTPEEQIAILTAALRGAEANLQELLLDVRAEKLQPDGAISPDWTPGYRGYVRTIGPERRMTTTAGDDGDVGWNIERGWIDDNGWHHWTTEWTGRWLPCGPDSARQEMACGDCATQREAMRAAEACILTYVAP